LDLTDGAKFYEPSFLSGHVVIITQRNRDDFADDGIVPDFRIWDGNEKKARVMAGGEVKKWKAKRSSTPL